MTITFIPGEANKSPNSISQALWKSHHIIAYGSGNNLIITTSTIAPTQINVTAKKVVTPTNHLQTIYLDSDPGPVHINANNGLIAIAIKSKIIIYKPLNEYMSKPQWLEALEISNDLDNSNINAVLWSLNEDELIVGSNETLTIYHIWDEFGSLLFNRRFCKIQPNPIDTIATNSSSTKIVTLNQSNYDNLVKIWSRINYDDDDKSLFELAYLKHPPGSWIKSIKWRLKDSETSGNATNSLDGSMANIKNIRSYIDDGMNDNEVLYTLSDDFVLRVWSTYEFSGHSHIKCWNQIDLNEFCGFDGESEIINVLIIDNYYLQTILLPYLKNNVNENMNLDFILDSNDYDICLVASKFGYLNLMSISNINGHPPNSIKFQKINNIPLRPNPNSFPFSVSLPQYDVESFDTKFLTSEECSVMLNPIDIPKISMAHSNCVSLLLHDRVKNTIRVVLFNFHHILSTNHSEFVGNKLINKFQGHTKSIRKLIPSTSSKKNILLSILNFPEHNYIWEPLVLNPKSNERMSLAKRFQLDVSQGHETNDQNCGIWNSILINDVKKASHNSNGHGSHFKLRHHLVVVCEKNGYLSFWNCNGVKGDDKAAVLLQRLDILDDELHKIYQEPKAFLCTRLSDKAYYVISIFEANLIRAWKIVVSETDDDDISIEVNGWGIENLPVDGHIHKITTVHSHISNTLLSLIDEKGTLQIFCINSKSESVKWSNIGKIHTNIPKATKIHGSSISNKFAVMDETKHKLTIWDMKSGLLEYEEVFPEENGDVRDLDWTVVESSDDTSTNAILSVGFSRFVLLYTQLRYDYTNNMPTFAVLKKIDILDYTSHEIGDLVWIDNEFLVIGSGNQFFIDDKWVQIGNSNNSSIDYIIKQLMMGYNHDDDRESTYEISHLVRILNGPLPVYHPQFLIQALFMNQIKLVHDILVRLFQCLRVDETVEWDLNMNLTDEILAVKKSRRKSTSLTHTVFNDDGGFDDIFATYSAELLDLLIEKLTKISLPLLTRHQQITLILVITIIKDLINIESLDKCGLRFLLGFKLFLMNLKQSKLTMRDINWGLHSDNRQLLLDGINQHYKNRLTWTVVKQCGISYWISDRDTLISIVEKCARNEFGDSRDPSGITSIFFLAIKKKQILIGLWKTVSHPEKQKMLKFLNNNFHETRWKSAALKNAFVLLGKHRYIDAAYFFLLADSIKDCCITLANKVEDIELAILVAKVYDDSANQETLTYLIENFILPKAIETGNRWVTSWIFWEMNLKELSIQALIKSPIGLVKENQDKFSESFITNHLNKIKLNSTTNFFLQDDPVLILLFDNLRQRKFNYLQGALSVDQVQETDFILKIASIYTRMGCDYLALLLIKDWQFIDHKVNEIDTKAADSNGQDSDNLFKEFKPTFSPTTQPTTFEEPDLMSSFDF